MRIIKLPLKREEEVMLKIFRQLAKHAIWIKAD
jgi:hypothetical protein